MVHDRDEVVAADMAEKRTLAGKRLAQQIRRRLDERIAHFEAVAVVIGFEMIQIDVENAELL